VVMRSPSYLPFPSTPCGDRSGLQPPRRPTTPSADFCIAVRAPCGSLSPSGCPWDTTQISWGKPSSLPRTPAGFTVQALDGYGLRDWLPARPTRAASYPVTVRQVAISFRASFKRSLAVPPLRITRASPPSGCTGDFHPQTAGHAQHTAWPLATACGGKGLTLLVTQQFATMRSTVACGSGNSCAKIIHVGIFIRILTGVHKGKPVQSKLRRGVSFCNHAISIFAKRSLDPSCEVVSDGLACFGAVAKAGCAHQVVKTGSGAAAARTPGFKWVNTALGNIKAAIVGTYRAIDQKHVPRYLAEFEYRFNRRYDLAAMMPRLTRAGVRTTPMPYRLLRLAEVYT